MIKLFFITTLLFINSYVNAFTNGTLLPSYLCGVQGDGYPKSVGGVIPFLKLGNVDTHYNQFAPGAGDIPIKINDGINLPAGNALAPNAQQIIGSFHNGRPETGYTTPITNIITIVPTDFTNLVSGVVDPNFLIYPGNIYNMSLIINYPNFNYPGIALDGSFVYAMDTITQKRVGEFTFFGDNMSPWYACSLNGLYPLNTGIVHNKLLTEETFYNVVWKAPLEIVGYISFIGAGVSDYGFGPFSVQYQTYKNCC